MYIQKSEGKSQEKKSKRQKAKRRLPVRCVPSRRATGPQFSKNMSVSLHFSTFPIHPSHFDKNKSQEFHRGKINLQKNVASLQRGCQIRNCLSQKMFSSGKPGVLILKKFIIFQRGKMYF